MAPFDGSKIRNNRDQWHSPDYFQKSTKFKKIYYGNITDGSENFAEKS